MAEEKLKLNTSNQSFIFNIIIIKLSDRTDKILQELTIIPKLPYDHQLTFFITLEKVKVSEKRNAAQMHSHFQGKNN